MARCSSLSRNSAFDAKNFFDAPAEQIPPFRRNQFGGMVSGPVIKDRTFFLASYEGLRQRLGVTSRSVVPDAGARQGVFPGRPAVPVNEAVQPYLGLIPLPNERNFGDGTGEFVLRVHRRRPMKTSGQDVSTTGSPHATSLFTRYTLDRAECSDSGRDAADEVPIEIG